MNRMNWLDRITTDTRREIADKTGLSHPTITRAANTTTPPPSVVIAVARAYGAPVPIALRNAGVLTTDELKQVTRAVALEHVPTTELLHELLRRALNSEATDSET